MNALAVLMNKYPDFADYVRWVVATSGQEAWTQMMSILQTNPEYINTIEAAYNIWTTNVKPNLPEARTEKAIEGADYEAFVAWFKTTYGVDPSTSGFTKDNFKTVRNNKGELFYDLYSTSLGDGEGEGDGGGEGEGDDGGIPEGYQVVIPGSLLYDPVTKKYYDYTTWNAGGGIREVPKETADKMISAWEAEQSPSTSTATLGGLPSKEQSADGAWWWVYRDKDGNIINVEEVADDETEMTAYEKAQYDLQKEQIAWEREQAATTKAEQDAQKYTSPREWIQRWGMQNAGSLPNAPSWLHETTGLNPNQPISAVTPKLMSGQSMSNMAPSELEGLYGFVDWTGGRGGKYASGEDYGYAAQKLLPTNAPRRTYAWNPNSRT